MKTRFMRLSAVAVTLSAALIGSIVVADVTKPRPVDKQIAMSVCALMENGHVTRHRVDETILDRLHKGYIEFYDPLKLYFLQSDIDEFDKLRASRTENVNDGRLGFMMNVYQQFLKRLDERNDSIQAFIKQKHDFNKTETMVTDRDQISYAKTPEELQERWRVRIKYDLLSRTINGDSLEKAQEKISKRYKTISKHWHGLDNDELIEYYMSSLTTSYDPHSTYMSAKTLEDFEIQMRHALEGIGALLQSEDGVTSIKEIVAGGAAEKDGRLKTGDKVLAVGEGESGELVEIQDMKIRDVVKLIRGKAGSKVRLQVTTDGSKLSVVTLERAHIALKDSDAKGEVVEVKDPKTGVTKKVGVIELKNFYANEEGREERDSKDAKTATNDMRKLIEKFKAEKVDCITVDLRNNGGGLLSEAISITGLFIKDGPVVQVRGHDGKVEVKMDVDDDVAWDGPLVVLVNKLSASASEIFAAAIQDYGRGLIVGDSSTHGKGTVQQIHLLSRIFRNLMGDNNMGAVKLTMQQFYRINGSGTQNRGVLSDVVLSSIFDNDEFGESKLPNAMKFSKIEPTEYASLGLVPTDVIKQVRKLSEERQKSDPELAKLLDRKKRFDERRAKKVITFDQTSMKKEREEMAQLEKEEKEIADEEEGVTSKKKKEEKFGQNAYTKEVLSIVNDFLRLGQNAPLAHQN